MRLQKTLLCAAIMASAGIAQAQSTAKGWYDAGQATIMSNGKRTVSTKKAKNVILMVGDGMGVSTVTAARILEGQLRGKTGEENLLSFEKLPHVALSKTYNTNQQTPDSAGTMTAMMTGVKTKAGVISINQKTLRGDCASSKGNELKTFLEEAEEMGKATGIISTARITHATPAATYSHSPERGWEDDKDMSQASKDAGCKDIASQLIDFKYGDGIDIAMGGGRRSFIPKTVEDPEDKGRKGERQDGRNLTTEWTKKGGNYKYVWNQATFDALPTAANTKILGLFNRSHMEYEADRAKGKGDEPSLSQMTKKALDILKQNQNGYFLMVESGRIDHGHHAGNAYRALTDTIEFAKTAQMVLDNVNLDETLVIVTADHSHVFTIAGYPTRGNPILGKVIGNGRNGLSTKTYAKDALGLPYTTLGYANGPGYTGASAKQAEGVKQYPHYQSPMGYKGITKGRPDLTNVDTKASTYMQESAVPMSSETHAAEDVAIYAAGPFAHTINGVVEQNVIYHAMKAAVKPSILSGGAITNVSGLWYNPKKSGVGFNFINADNGLTFTYYAYNKASQPLWLVAGELYTGKMMPGKSFTMKVLQAGSGKGAKLDTAPTGAANGTLPWGKATFTFDSCTKGKAVLQGTDGTVTIPLVKLANAGATCIDK